ncbi:MAG: hypothetical protein P8L68_11205 [Paracoccaceae bacterium]|nr:hypothetical protein [Paracoccaceae bacterium]MDG2259051.1 hypothetical protein [Paracoccaceae bacterium]
MSKRQTFTAIAFAATLAATPVVADEFSDRVVNWLEEQGFTHFEIKRTWLGRIKIEAYANGIEREIILNGRTGEILRDYWEVEHDDAEDATILLVPAPADIGNSRGVMPVQVVEDENDDESEHDDDVSEDDSSDDPESDEEDDSDQDEDEEDDEGEDDDDDDAEDEE